VNSEEFIPLVVQYGTESDQPLLGLATTRQLLEELQARGDVDSVVHQMLGSAYMTSIAKKLLHTLPEELLDYRTVDGR
jgi:hypothetical protein